MAITHPYSPDVFTLVPMSQLTRQHFDLHPIWSEYYDFEEREEIASWGIDRKWLDRELLRVHDGNDHGAYPILRPYPLPERMRLYIRARFLTPDGDQLDGYVMNEDAGVINLFVGTEQYCFSKTPLGGDLDAKALHAIRKTMERMTLASFRCTMRPISAVRTTCSSAAYSRQGFQAADERHGYGNLTVGS
jgi:hypothetical protein